MRRSTWRDMKPSLSLMRLRRSQASAARAPAAPPSAKRPAGSPASVVRGQAPGQRGDQVLARRRPGRAGAAPRRSPRSPPPRSATNRPRASRDSSGISRRARSQRAWGRTLAGTRTSRARGASGVSASSANRRGAREQVRLLTGLGMHQDPLEAGRASRPARCAARSGRPATRFRAAGSRASAGAGRITRKLRTETAAEESVVTGPIRPAWPGGAARRRGGSTRARRTRPRRRPPPRRDCGSVGARPSTRARTRRRPGRTSRDAGSRRTARAGAGHARSRAVRAEDHGVVLEARCVPAAPISGPGCAALRGPRQDDVRHGVREGAGAPSRCPRPRSDGGAASRDGRCTARGAGAEPALDHVEDVPAVIGQHAAARDRRVEPPVARPAVAAAAGWVRSVCQATRAHRPDRALAEELGGARTMGAWCQLCTVWSTRARGAREPGHGARARRASPPAASRRARAGRARARPRSGPRGSTAACRRRRSRVVRGQQGLDASRTSARRAGAARHSACRAGWSRWRRRSSTSGRSRQPGRWPCTATLPRPMIAPRSHPSLEPMRA